MVIIGAGYPMGAPAAGSRIREDRRRRRLRRRRAGSLQRDASRLSRNAALNVRMILKRLAYLPVNYQDRGTLARERSEGGPAGIPSTGCSEPLSVRSIDELLFRHGMLLSAKLRNRKLFDTTKNDERHGGTGDQGLTIRRRLIGMARRCTRTPRSCSSGSSTWLHGPGPAAERIQVIAHQNDVGCTERDVGATPDRQPKSAPATRDRR